MGLGEVDWGEAISVDPGTGLERARWRRHSPRQVDALLDRARQAQAAWAATSVTARGVALLELAEAMEAEREALARLAVGEMGKPIVQARAEIDKCADLCRWYGTSADRLMAEEAIAMDGADSASLACLPLGIILGVMPWNFPFWQGLRAAIPTLLVGNAFLLKPSDNVQGCAQALQAVFERTSIPRGLMTVLDVDQSRLPALIEDGRVAGLSVTAGVEAGAALAAVAGQCLKKTVLELGGSDAFIVLADADLNVAVAAAVEARFQNCGQVCIAAKRFIVERSVHSEFVDRFVTATARLRVGPPLDETTQVGPLASARTRQRLHAQIGESVDMGARPLLGGKIPDGAGFFYPPTVLAGVSPDMPVFREETFGPVAPIIEARDAAHALAIANDSPYGLSASLWTADLDLARAMARDLHVGSVFVNGPSRSDKRLPIGGVKASGYGRELSVFGLREFANIQTLWIADGGDRPSLER